MKRKIVIRGERVQDVGYRLFLLEIAERLGLRGFQARNVGDHVECFVEGDEERVHRFLEIARSSHPEFAVVREVADEEYRGDVMSVEGFYRLFSLEQLVKIVNAGLGMLQKQDSMLEKQDLMLQKQDSMLEKQDLMLQKQDEIIEEIRALRFDLKAWMNERFSKIEKEIAEIKARIGMK